MFFALNQTNDTVTGQCSAHVIAGDKRTLQCTADGEPHPSVVILNEKGERVANGSRNAFYRFTARKNETYECGAKTAAINSTANAKFVLCVTPRPCTENEGKCFSVTLYETIYFFRCPANNFICRSFLKPSD